MTDNQDNILRVEEKGIEYYTIVATGETGMSQRGLARACGVSHVAIGKLVKGLSLVTKSPSKWLDPFAGKGSDLVTKISFLGENSSSYRKKGGLITAYKADFCAAVIKHYAYQGSEKAQESDSRTGVIGLAHHIHVITGYTPKQYAAAPQAQESLCRILSIPRPWEKMFEPDFCRTVFSWFGAQFYWQWVYNMLSDEEKAKHDDLNPVSHGKRNYRIHQFLTESTKERLEDNIKELVLLVVTSTSRQDFLTRASRLKGFDQLELKF